jgi:hypothetical protein
MQDQTQPGATQNDREELISPGCSLFFIWIAASSIGLGLGWLLGWWLSFRLPGVLASLTIGLVTGLVLGLFQWLLLRASGERITWWIPVTAVTWGAGFLIGTFAASRFGLTGALFGVFSGACMGLLVGAGQWLVMRKTSKRSVLWIPVSTFGLGAAFMFYTPGLSGWGLLYGLLYGFVTSPAVLFMLYAE